MNDQALKFRLGIFVLGSAVVLAVLVILFGEFPAIFTRQIPYEVVFAQAPGVEQGTPVRKSGVRIGEVTGFELDPDTGRVQIAFFVERKYQLRRGDQPYIGRGLLLGETSVDFVPAKQDREPAPAGHVFQGEMPTDLRQALEKAPDLLTATQSAVEELRNTARAINEFMPHLQRATDEVQVAARNFGKAAERIDVVVEENRDRVRKTLEDIGDVTSRAANVLSDDNQKNLTAALRNVRTASDNFDTTVKNADVLITDARKTLKSVGDRVETVGKNTEELVKDARGTLKRVNESLGRTDELVTTLQQAIKPVAEKSAAVMKNLEDGSARFSEMSMDLREFTRALSEGDGTLRRIVVDPALYNRLNEGANALNKTMVRLDRILRDVEVFADKIARHPEVLGVGGAVSPSGGLKQSPGRSLRRD